MSYWQLPLCSANLPGLTEKIIQVSLNPEQLLKSIHNTPAQTFVSPSRWCPMGAGGATSLTDSQTICGTLLAICF